MLAWTIAFVVGILYAHLIEYAAHRWFMHPPAHFGRHPWYLEHAVEHHGRNRNDVNISLSFLSTFAVASPLLVFCLWAGWPWLATVAIGSWLYARTWTILHHAHHDLAYLWLHTIPAYWYWRHHHVIHHVKPNRNYGTVFPWTDRLFGTRL